MEVAAGTAMMTSDADPLPTPGTTLHEDFRANLAPLHRDTSSELRPLRLLTFNIERGYQLQAVIQLLKEYDADIAYLQEIDIGNARSQNVDTGRAIAKALQLNYIFVCEFEELYDAELRQPRDQGGGVHGNAILTKYDVSDIDVLTHTVEPVDWAKEGASRGEPRRGRRYTLSCTVHVPACYHADADQPGKRQVSTIPVQVYTAHLELFCGLSHRLAAIADMFYHYRRLRSSRSVQHAVIAGDFNTLAHSIARLSPKYCKDAYRWQSLGYTEAEFVCKHVLNVFESVETTINSAVDSSLLDAATRQKLVNPHFVDPFDAYDDVTLRSYQGLFQGKLDWLLMRSIQVIATHVGNHDYLASDHKLLAVDCRLSDQLITRPHMLTRPRPGICTYSTSPAVLAVQIAVVVAMFAAALAKFL